MDDESEGRPEGSDSRAQQEERKNATRLEGRSVHMAVATAGGGGGESRKVLLVGLLLLLLKYIKRIVFSLNTV